MVRWWVLVHCGQVNRRNVNIDIRYLPSWFLFGGGRQANLTGPLLPRNEAMEAPQNRRFCFDVYRTSLQPRYIDERRTILAKAYGMKVRCLYGERVGEHIGNTLGT